MEAEKRETKHITSTKETNLKKKNYMQLNDITFHVVIRIKINQVLEVYNKSDTKLWLSYLDKSLAMPKFLVTLICLTRL